MSSEWQWDQRQYVSVCCWQPKWTLWSKWTSCDKTYLKIGLKQKKEKLKRVKNEIKRTPDLICIKTSFKLFLHDIKKMKTQVAGYLAPGDSSNRTPPLSYACAAIPPLESKTNYFTDKTSVSFNDTPGKAVGKKNVYVKLLHLRDTIQPRYFSHTSLPTLFTQHSAWVSAGTRLIRTGQ